jgi:hypothetical protein
VGGTTGGVGGGFTITAGNAAGAGNVAGGAVTLKGGLGANSGAGGAILFQTAATTGPVATRLTIDAASTITVADAVDLVFNTTTGSKIGTATTQKLGFFNATPIVQPGATTDLGTVLSNLGLRAAGTAYPITTSGAVALTGTVTSSTLALKAGNSTGNIAKAGGSISVNTSTVGNVGVGEDDLMTYAIPASTLNTNNDRVRFRAVGTIANSINAKRLRLKYGGTTVLDTGAAGFPISAAIQWVLEGEIIRTGSATQKCSANLSTNNASLASYVGYSTAAETLSDAVTLKLTGEATDNNDVVQESMSVTWESAP